MSGGKDIYVVSRPGADVATRDSIPYGITVYNSSSWLHSVPTICDTKSWEER